MGYHIYGDGDWTVPVENIEGAKRAITQALIDHDDDAPHPGDSLSLAAFATHKPTAPTFPRQTGHSHRCFGAWSTTTPLPPSPPGVWFTDTACWAR